MDLDKKLNELKEIADKLDAGNISFEEGIKLYEKGAELAKESMQVLNESKGKVLKIKQDLDAVKEEEF